MQITGAPQESDNTVQHKRVQRVKKEMEAKFSFQKNVVGRQAFPFA